MPKKVVVLGAGRVGKAIALDLADRYEVVAVDTNGEALAKLHGAGLKTANADPTDRTTLDSLVAGSDLVINALPGYLGFKVLKNIIDCGKNVVDISFSPENPLELDGLAKNKKVTAVVDCGVAPGLSNMILGFHYKQMEVKNFVCYVGGLPKVRVWPYEYKAPFSPIDVIEEYTRPARLVENGPEVVKEALSEPEYLDFEKIGMLEAFNTDGLRTLLASVKIPNMKEKTLRYPGHIGYMKVLRETGFFNKEPIDVRGAQVSPMEMTSKILFPHWQLKEGEEEFTVMRVIIEGKEDGKLVKYVYNLYDEYDKDTGLTSMARTTGYTCTAVASLILEGGIDMVGIVPPEVIAIDRNKFGKVLSYLKERGVDLDVQRIF